MEMKMIWIKMIKIKKMRLENEQNEIEERINKVNEDYFHLKYEMRYFV